MKYQTHVYSNFLQRCCLFVDKSIKRFKKIYLMQEDWLLKSIKIKLGSIILYSVLSVCTCNLPSIRLSPNYNKRCMWIVED